MGHSSYSMLRFATLGLRGFAALCIFSLVFASAKSAFAQRRSMRDGGSGAGASRDAPGGGGYGATSGGAGAANSSGGTKSGVIDEKQYPARKNDPAAGPIAEYRKPTYEHYRFVVSPDGTKIALSGSHIEKENAGTPNEKPKRDPAGKFIVKEKVLEVIDAGSGRSLIAFKPPSLFENLALSSDNMFLAVEAADRPGVVNVMHLPTRKSKEFKTELRRIVPGGIVFSSDGRLIHVVAPDRLLSIAMGSGEVKELKYEIPSPAATYSAAMNLAAVGVSRSKQGRPEVQIYDVATGKQTKQVVAASGPTCLVFSADGKWLVATVVGGALAAWQTSDWTSAGRVAGKIGSEPGQLSISPDGGLVAVRPRLLGKEGTRIIDIKSGEVTQSVRTRDAFFLPAGALAVANNAGPYVMEVSSGNISDLGSGANGGSLVQSVGSPSPFADSAGVSRDTSPPAGQAGYGALARQPTSTQPGYGALTGQPTSAQAGYGAVTGQPTSAQPGYGAVSTPPSSSQPGYGAVNGQPTSAQPGYGAVTTPPSSSQPGYGAVNGQPTSSQPGYGAVNGQPTSAQPGYGAVNGQPTSAQPGYGAVNGQPTSSQPGVGQEPSPSSSERPNRQLATRLNPTESEDPLAQEFQSKTSGTDRLAISLDGSRLAAATVRELRSGTVSLTVSIWDLAKGTEITSFKSEGFADWFAFSPDANYLVAGMSPREKSADLRVWHLPTGKEKVFPPDKGRMSGPPAFFADSKSILSQHLSYVRITPIDGQSPKNIPLQSYTSAMAFCAERNELACGFGWDQEKHEQPMLAIHKLPGNKPHRTIRLTALPTTVGYSPDSNCLAVGMTGGQISIFDTKEWKELFKIAGGEQKGYSRIAVANGAKFVVASPAEGESPALLVWRGETGTPLKTLLSTDHAFLPNGLLVKAMSQFGSVMFHDLGNNKDVWPWEKKGNEPQSAPAIGYGAVSVPAPASTESPPAAAPQTVPPQSDRR